MYPRLYLNAALLAGKWVHRSLKYNFGSQLQTLCINFFQVRTISEHRITGGFALEIGEYLFGKRKRKVRDIVFLYGINKNEVVK